MIIALYIITGMYVLLIVSLIYGFRRLPNFDQNNSNSDHSFSVIIPFRNEADHLPQLLESIEEIDYPKDRFEVLFVNDDSQDRSVEIIRDNLKDTGIQYQVLANHRSSKSPKKDAIKTAIQQAQFDWILTTDADCILPNQWLQTFAFFIQQQDSEMVVGPVSYASVDYSFAEHFQILDFLSLQGSTVGGFGIGKPFLCNGANLAYKKETFLTLNGFDGNDQIASGDDIFLFEKFLQKYPNKVHFLKSKLVIVTTFPLKSWKEVTQQRTRWAAKSGSYQLGFTKLVGLIVFLMNLGWVLGIGLMFWEKEFLFFLNISILKIMVDWAMIDLTSSFYQSKTKGVRRFLSSFVLYPFFSIFIALRAIFLKYTWKGRRFKK